MGLSGSTGLGKLNYAKYWMYNPHLALRWNMDPKTRIGINPYRVFADNPIKFVDPLGDDTKELTMLAKKTIDKYTQVAKIKRYKKNGDPVYTKNWDYEPEFAKMYNDWKNNDNMLVEFTTSEEALDGRGGTIAYKGVNKEGQKVYQVIWDESLTTELGASGVFEEAYHLKDAIEGVELKFAGNGTRYLDIYDEVRAKKWVTTNIKSFKETYQIRDESSGKLVPFKGETHYGHIKTLGDNDIGIAEFLQKGARTYANPMLHLQEGTQVGGTNTQYQYNIPHAGGSGYRKMSKEEKSAR